MSSSADCLLACQHVKKKPWRDDSHVFEALEHKQILIAGDDVFRVASQGRLDQRAVVGVAANTSRTRGINQFAAQTEQVRQRLNLSSLQVIFLKYSRESQLFNQFVQDRCGINGDVTCLREAWDDWADRA